MDESNGIGQQFMFADFCLDPAARICTSGGREVHLAQRPFEVLVFLVANRDRVVSRTELLEKFWDGHDVYDDALRKCVGAIRKALNDLERPGRFIETRYGGGYRFIADVGVVTKNGNGSASGNGTKPELRAVQGEIDADESDELPNASGYLRRVIIALLVFAGLGLALTFFVQNYQPWPFANAGENAGGYIRSIAVMPMKNLTGDAANEYYSDGITDSIISELSRIDGLRVISRTSTFALKGRDIDPVEVGQKLNVETFLEGSLKTKGDILNVDVRLISTVDGSVLWSSANFERPVAAAYELQGVVLCDLANRIREGSCEGRATQNTVSSDAYQAYLKGRFQWNKRTAEGIRKSIEEYDRAIAFDPGYALPYAGLAESYVQGVWHVPFTAKDVLPKAETAALKAISLNDNLAEAHTALASVYGLQWRWADADHELRRALEINPRYARAHHVQAFAFATLGQQEEALLAIERARDLDPLNLVINTDVGVLLANAGRYDEALRQWDRTLELDPAFEMVFVHRFIAYALLDNETASIESYLKLQELQGRSAGEIAATRATASNEGLKGIYRKELADYRAQAKRGETVPFVNIAIFHVLLGENDEAFEYLEKGLARRDAEMVLIKSDRRFIPLHSDPRYNDILERMGLPR